MDPFQENEDAERSKIRQELSTMSFEELQKLKEKLGTKILNNSLFGKKSKESVTFTRANKNRPREIPSKVKPVKLKMNTEVPKKRIKRDPRFDDLSGTFNEKHFEKSYSFITELKSKEMEVLKEAIQTTEDEVEKKKIQSYVLRMDTKKKAEEKKKEVEEMKRTHKKQELEKIKRGKKPFFLKKSVLKMESLKKKFEMLKKSGKLENYMSKKRKQNAAKEKKKLPLNV